MVVSPIPRLRGLSFFARERIASVFVAAEAARLVSKIYLSQPRAGCGFYFNTGAFSLRYFRLGSFGPLVGFFTIANVTLILIITSD